MEVFPSRLREANTLNRALQAAQTELGERRRSEKLLVRELQHRTNNLLTIVQVMAQRSLSGATSLQECKERFERRLQALARVHRELTKSHTAELTLDSIVRFTLEPYFERFNITGDKVRLGAKQAQNVAFAIHKLATNAVKYGALSNTEKNVEVSWKVADASGEAILHLKWYERDGSPVLSPERVSFGTSLLKASFGDIKLEFASEGLRCEIREVLN